MPEHISLDATVYMICRCCYSRGEVAKLISPDDKILFEWAIV